MEQQYYSTHVSSDQEIYNSSNNLITFPPVEDYERIHQRESDLQIADFNQSFIISDTDRLHSGVYDNNRVISPLQQNPSSVVLNCNQLENHAVSNFSPQSQSSSMQKRSKKMVSFKSNENLGKRTSQYRGVTRYKLHKRSDSMHGLIILWY